MQPEQQLCLTVALNKKAKSTSQAARNKKKSMHEKQQVDKLHRMSQGTKITLQVAL